MIWDVVDVKHDLASLDPVECSPWRLRLRRLGELSRSFVGNVIVLDLLASTDIGVA